MKFSLPHAAAVLLLSPLGLGAQELPSAPSAVLAQEASATRSATATIKFATPRKVDAGSGRKRLNTEQKFNSFVSQSTSPYTTFSSAIAASFRPSWNSSQYSENYGSRFGQSLSDQNEQGFFTKFLLPSMFHQDPRYFRSSDATTGGRFMYAVSRILVTRNDNEKSTLNSSEIVGSMIAASLSTAYHPYHHPTLGGAAAAAAGNMSTDAGINVLREFWPDIRGHLVDHGSRMVQTLVSMAPRTISGTARTDLPTSH